MPVFLPCAAAVDYAVRAESSCNASSAMTENEVVPFILLEEYGIAGQALQNLLSSGSSV